MRNFNIILLKLTICLIRPGFSETTDVKCREVLPWHSLRGWWELCSLIRSHRHVDLYQEKPLCSYFALRMVTIRVSETSGTQPSPRKGAHIREREKITKIFSLENRFKSRL
jgi:hypothetical protein